MNGTYRRMFGYAFCCLAGPLYLIAKGNHEVMAIYFVGSLVLASIDDVIDEIRGLK